MKLFGYLQDSRKKKRAFNTIVVIFFCAVLSSCAVGSTIITGNSRPATNPSEVKIYIDPPTQYETIGIVEASSDVEFSRQSAQERVINHLKSRAAKMGANGLLLTNTGSQSGGSSGFYSNGFFYGGASSKMVGQGRAIFVIHE